MPRIPANKTGTPKHSRAKKQIEIFQFNTKVLLQLTFIFYVKVLKKVLSLV
jgi:hypothetical protein